MNPMKKYSKANFIVVLLAVVSLLVILPSPEAAAETITESVIPETGETPEEVSDSEESVEQMETADNNPPEPDTVEERTDEEGLQDVTEETDKDEPVGEESTEVPDLPEMSDEKGSSEEE